MIEHCPSLPGNHADATLAAVLRSLVRTLEAAAVDSPRLSAEVLLAAALGLDRQEFLKLLILEPGKTLTPDETTAADAFALRRASGEPVAYIVGEKEFYGRPFKVSPAVLVPRPETELLIDLALKHAEGLEHGLFADFGTGSGCIAVTLALELPGWQGAGLDISPSALALARRNALRLGAGSLLLLQADFAPPPLKAGSLDLLLSNPPYVSEAEYQQLDNEVRRFEPKSALVPAGNSGKETPADGLEDALRIMASAHALLKPGGCLLVEIGCSQAEALCAAARRESLWSEVAVHTDLAGLDRVVTMKRARAQACRFAAKKPQVRKIHNKSALS